jgi:putative flippase GtrA
MLVDTQSESTPLHVRLRFLIMHPHRVMELIRYGSVGLFNNGLYFAIYSGIIVAGGPYWAAAVVGVFISALSGYWLHEHFSFQGGNPSWRGLGMWLGAQSGATVLNLALLTVLIHGLHIEEILAQLMLLPVIPAATYFLGRRWIFTRAGAETASVAARRSNR